MSSRSSDSSGGVGVCQSGWVLITACSSDARKLNLPCAHVGLRVHFDFFLARSQRTRTRVDLKASRVVDGQWNISSELFFFLFFSFFFYYFMCRYSPHCCMHTCYVMLLYPLLKVRAVSCHFWLEGPPFINLAVERARAHAQGGRMKHIVIFSHCTKVASLISARTSGQKSTQLKSGQICERAT